MSDGPEPSGGDAFDIIIVGAGAAGLSLAYHLAQSSLADRRILLLEPGRKDRDDRTWSFWSDSPTPFDALALRSWNRLRFVGPEARQTLALRSFRYQIIRGIAFYRFVFDALSTKPNVRLVRASVERVEDGEGGPGSSRTGPATAAGGSSTAASAGAIWRPAPAGATSCSSSTSKVGRSKPTTTPSTRPPPPFSTFARRRATGPASFTSCPSRHASPSSSTCSPARRRGRRSPRGGLCRRPPRRYDATSKAPSASATTAWCGARAACHP